MKDKASHLYPQWSLWFHRHPTSSIAWSCNFLIQPIYIGFTTCIHECKLIKTTISLKEKEFEIRPMQKKCFEIASQWQNKSKNVARIQRLAFNFLGANRYSSFLIHLWKVHFTVSKNHLERFLKCRFSLPTVKNRFGVRFQNVHF